VTSKREFAARALGSLGLTRACQAFGPRGEGTVTILAYHRVADVPDEDAFPFDIELVSASADAFRRQMDHLARHFNPVTFETVLAHLDRGEPPPPRAAIVTFDDGFADNYHTAFPILRERGMPATIFVATGFLDRQENYWYERLAHAVLTSPARSVLGEGGVRLKLGTGAAPRRAVLHRLLSWLKRIADEERRERLDDLARQLAPVQDGNGDPRSGPLTWEQVREMSAAGIEFGSHSVNHPVLARTRPEALAYELRESKSRIETETGRPVNVLAYPVGGVDAFNPAVQAAARSAGYRLGVSYLPGVERAGQWDPFALRRLRVERYVSDPLYRAMLALPGVFAQ